MSILTPKITGYVNLSYCVAMVEMDRQDYSGRLREIMTQYAIHRWSQRAMTKNQNVEVVYLEMDAQGIVDISTLTDFVDYVKIGIPVNGKIWILSKNKKILKRRDELSAEQDALIFNNNTDTLPVDYGYYFAGHYVNGQYINGLFGFGGGLSRSYFTFDEEKMEFQFDSVVPRSEIILEYTSTGVKVTGATTIPRIYVDDIREYIHWQLNEHDPRINRFDKDRKKQNFIEAENIVDSHLMRFNSDDYYNMMYSTTKQLKR